MLGQVYPPQSRKNGIGARGACVQVCENGGMQEILVRWVG